MYFPEFTINTSSIALLKLLGGPSYTLTPNDPWFIQALSKMNMPLFVAPSLDWDSNCSKSYTKYSKTQSCPQTTQS